MTVRISDPRNISADVVALMLLGWRENRRSLNIVHDLIPYPTGGTPAYQVQSIASRGAAPRSGTFRLLFDSEADSEECVTFHAATAGHPLNLTLDGDEDQRPSISPTGGFWYVLDADGTLTRELDDSTRDLWIVTVPFQETPQ